MFQAYHGVTGAEHQANFNDLAPRGFRMISLSVYGDSDDPRYAAVWVQRSGPAWVAVHGVDASGYQAFFNTSTAAGYAPILVSAVGPADSAVFAAVFEQGIDAPWSAQHGLTDGPAANAGTFQHAMQIAADARMILRSAAVYGTMSDRRFAAIWHSNPGYTKWHVHFMDSGTTYQTVFDAQTQLPGFTLHGYRPAYVAVSAEGLYCSVFEDDVVGPWVARHGMSASEYQDEFNRQNEAGLYPICTQGGGSTDEPIYAAIFAGQDIPANREWTANGTGLYLLLGLDHVMQRFMQANAVRAAQLAVAKHGHLLFSRGYTWAEAGYRITRTSDRFLLASVSKMFLAAVVQNLYDRKLLSPSTQVYPLLGFRNPADSRSDLITVQQLLDHTAGYDDSSTGSGFDPTYHMRDIALALGLGSPVTKLDVARYMYGTMLDFDPGTNYKYCNYGYLLAAAVVEHVTGQRYADYLHSAVLAPAGIKRVRVMSTLASGRADDEAIGEDEDLGLSALDVASNLQVPAVYGGSGEIHEVGDAQEGMAASAEALVQFIHTHAVWGNGGRTPGKGRSGSTPGASTYAESRDDGIDWAYVINTRDFPPNASPTLNDLNHSIGRLLDTTPVLDIVDLERLVGMVEGPLHHGP